MHSRVDGEGNKLELALIGVWVRPLNNAFASISRIKPIEQFLGLGDVTQFPRYLRDFSRCTARISNSISSDFWFTFVVWNKFSTLKYVTFSKDL